MIVCAKLVVAEAKAEPTPPNASTEVRRHVTETLSFLKRYSLRVTGERVLFIENNEELRCEENSPTNHIKT